ncbi:MAG: SDR family NAD(P)-dependent oxidoreductase [Ruminiclostridium sp.]
MQTLKGRTCVFSGAAGGDSVKAVQALCESGMNVVMTTRKPEKAEKVIRELPDTPDSGICTYFCGEKGKDPVEYDAETYRMTAERFGSVDVIICNTGSDGQLDDIETLKAETLEKSLSHLAVGSFRMLQAALPWLKQSKSARVIFMTSAEGCMGGTCESLANAVAKGAVRSLTLNCAARLAEAGITVNCISKGAILRKEEYTDNVPNPWNRIHTVPMKRIGTEEDLAAVICFLASEEASYITGQVIELNGGLNLGR